MRGSRAIKLQAAIRCGGMVRAIWRVVSLLAGRSRDMVRGLSTSLALRSRNRCIAPRKTARGYARGSGERFFAGCASCLNDVNGGGTVGPRLAFARPSSASGRTGFRQGGTARGPSSDSGQAFGTARRGLRLVLMWAGRLQMACGGCWRVFRPSPQSSPRGRGGRMQRTFGRRALSR